MYRASLKVGPAPRILITRLSAIGDCIHSAPIATAIRQSFPNAFVAWVIQSAGNNLLSGHPDVDEFIPIDKQSLRRLSGMLELRSVLRKYQFDISIDPQSLTKSSLLAMLSGARHRIGFTRGQGRELAPWLNNLRVAPTQIHVVDRYLELLRPLGIHHPEVVFKIPGCQELSGELTRFMQQFGDRRFAVINPGAGWDSKLWPAERLTAVAEHLWQTHTMRSVVVWAGSREEAWAQQIADSAATATRLAPKTTLPELADLTRKASLFIGSDTGPMHLAAAVGTPCVALFGPTQKEICGPYGAGHQAIQCYYQSGTSRQRRGSDNRAMQAITVAQVQTACDRVLQNGIEPSRATQVA